VLSRNYVLRHITTYLVDWQLNELGVDLITSLAISMILSLLMGDFAQIEYSVCRFLD